MNLLKTKKGFLALAALVTAFGLFAGVAFVQSQESETAPPEQTTEPAATCPYAKGAQVEKASAMPGSCSELHGQALAAGRMTEEGHAAAEAAVAAVTGGSTTMTVAQCREVLTKLGYECTETAPQACTEKLKAIGITTAQVTADDTGKAKHDCATADPALCAAMKAKGLCGAASGAKADASTGAAEVAPAVQTENAPAAAGKQCDLTKKESCAPAPKTGGDDR